MGSSRAGGRAGWRGSPDRRLTRWCCFLQAEGRIRDLTGTGVQTCALPIFCQYLFAGATLKQNYGEGGVTYGQLEQMRRWKSTIMAVARQEMEHLGIVTNLLTAIGEAPHFDRPEVPPPPSIPPLDQEAPRAP